MRIAIFDLGSTSFHLLVADICTLEIRRVLRRREMLHLAAAAAPDGHIPPDAAFQALRAVRTLRSDADDLRPDIVIATATSALRDAANGDHLLERMEIVLRSPIRTLGGPEEAGLAFDGATAGLGVPAHEEVLVADLGGGSLDVAVGRRGCIEIAETYPLGASRMTALHVHHDPPTDDELTVVEDAVNTACAGLFERIAARPPMRVIVAGGTGRAIARIATGRDDVNGAVIPAGKLHKVTRRLASMTREERLSLNGVQGKRASVLPAGSLVLSTLIDGLEAAGLTTSHHGLREGLLHELLVELDRAPLPIAR